MNDKKKILSVVLGTTGLQVKYNYSVNGARWTSQSKIRATPESSLVVALKKLNPFLVKVSSLSAFEAAFDDADVKELAGEGLLNILMNKVAGQVKITRADFKYKENVLSGVILYGDHINARGDNSPVKGPMISTVGEAYGFEKNLLNFSERLITEVQNYLSGRYEVIDADEAPVEEAPKASKKKTKVIKPVSVDDLELV